MKHIPTHSHLRRKIDLIMTFAHRFISAHGTRFLLSACALIFVSIVLPLTAGAQQRDGSTPAAASNDGMEVIDAQHLVEERINETLQGAFARRKDAREELKRRTRERVAVSVKPMMDSLEAVDFAHIDSARSVVRAGLEERVLLRIAEIDINYYNTLMEVYHRYLNSPLVEYAVENVDGLMKSPEERVAEIQRRMQDLKEKKRRLQREIEDKKSEIDPLPSFLTGLTGDLPSANVAEQEREKNRIETLIDEHEAQLWTLRLSNENGQSIPTMVTDAFVRFDDLSSKIGNIGARIEHHMEISEIKGRTYREGVQVLNAWLDGATRETPETSSEDEEIRVLDRPEDFIDH